MNINSIKSFNTKLLNVGCRNYFSEILHRPATFDEYRIPFNAFFSTQLGWEFNSECFLEKFPPSISQSNRNCPTSAVNTMFRSLDPISDSVVIDGILAHVSAHRLECERVWLNWSKEKLMKLYGYEVLLALIFLICSHRWRQFPFEDNRIMVPVSTVWTMRELEMGNISHLLLLTFLIIFSKWNMLSAIPPESFHQRKPNKW